MSVPKQSLKAIKAELMSPTINPLVEPQQIQTRHRLVKSGRSDNLVNANGDASYVSVIYLTEEKDDEEFVKVFADGVAASYDLTKTAQRVFQVVLDLYQRTPMNRGYADSVNLFWFGDGIEGANVNMSERTWQRGLRELLDKRFIAPKDPVSYWVNPALFFKGDRVKFVTEYRRRTADNDASRRMQKAVDGNTNTHDLADTVDQAERDFINNATKHIGE